MFVLADAFRRTEAPLTASVQMLPQTMQDVTIELVEGSAWKAEAEVVRPPSAVPVQFRIQPTQRLETVSPVRDLMQDWPFPLLGLLRGKQFPVSLTATEQVPPTVYRSWILCQHCANINRQKEAWIRLHTGDGHPPQVVLSGPGTRRRLGKHLSVDS